MTFISPASYVEELREAEATCHIPPGGALIYPLKDGSNGEGREVVAPGLVFCGHSDLGQAQCWHPSQP